MATEDMGHGMTGNPPKHPPGYPQDTQLELEVYAADGQSTKAMWGWIAGTVVLALVLVFVFARQKALHEADQKVPSEVTSLGECTVTEEQGVTLLKDCTRSKVGIMYKKR